MFKNWFKAKRNKNALPSKIESIFEYNFSDQEHLRRSITHKSYANEKSLPYYEHNERYELLGDAVLDLAITHLILEMHPEFTEGQLSKIRASVVNEQQLARISRKLNLGAELILGKGEKRSRGQHKSSILADAYEAILGGIYMDGGYEPCKQVIRRHFTSMLKNMDEEQMQGDFKTRLQEKAQGSLKIMPRYKVIAQHGPDHKKTFEVEVTIKDQRWGLGKGKSKKEAEQNAAKLALQRLSEQGEGI